MRFIFKSLLAAVLLLPVVAGAQTVKEVTVKKGKESVPAFSVKIKHAKSLTQKVLKEQEEVAGLKKSKHKKGFNVYKGIVWPAISSNHMDYFYKIKGNRRKSTVYFVVSKGYDNYISSASDANTATGINTFLTTLNEKVETQKQIDKKEAELQKIAKEKDKKEKEIELLKTK